MAQCYRLPHALAIPPPSGGRGHDDGARGGGAWLGLPGVRRGRACYAGGYEQIERAPERIGRFVQRNR